MLPPGRLIAPETRPTVPVRMTVIAGIPGSVPGDFAEKHVGSTSQDSSLSQERSGPAPMPPGALEGLTVRFCSNDCGIPFLSVCYGKARSLELAVRHLRLALRMGWSPAPVPCLSDRWLLSSLGPEWGLDLDS